MRTLSQPGRAARRVKPARELEAGKLGSCAAASAAAEQLRERCPMGSDRGAMMHHVRVTRERCAMGLDTIKTIG